LITIGCVIETKERHNVSAGQQIVEGLLKQKSKITIGSVMMMTKKMTECKCGTVNYKGFVQRV